MKKKTLKSSKTVAIVAAGLAAVAVGTVGFASWIISGATSTTTSKSISVAVADVVDQRFNLSVDEENSDLSLRFDAKSDDSTGPITFSEDSSGLGGEDLEISIKWTVTASDTSKDITSLLSKVTATFNSVVVLDSYIVTPWTVSSSSSDSSTYTYATLDIYSSANNSSSQSGTNWKTEVTGYIATGSTTSTSDTTISGTAYSITYKTTLTFAWGSATNSVNPGDYSGSDESSISAYISALSALKSLNSSGAWGTITLTPTAK